MKKKITVTALAMALLMTGCGNSISQSDSAGTAATQPSVPEETSAPAAEPAAEEITTTEATTTAPETTTTTLTTVDPSEYQASTSEWVGEVIIADRYEGDKVRGIMPFYSTDIYGYQYAEAINECKDLVGEDINVYNMTCPMSAAFYLPDDLSFDLSDMKESLGYIDEKIADDVTNINIYDTLQAHASEYIFARTDHHWNPLGAYYAEAQFAEAAGVPHADLSEYDEWKIEDFCGSMYFYSGGVSQLMEYPDTFIYYKPQNEYEVTYYDNWFNDGYYGDLFFDDISTDACYSAILGGDENICEIMTDVDNDRCIVLVKDSFGNALVPFLVTGFEKIYVVDFRYAEIYLDDFVETVGATDILFAVSMSSAFTPQHIESIENIL